MIYAFLIIVVLCGTYLISKSLGSTHTHRWSTHGVFVVQIYKNPDDEIPSRHRSDITQVCSGCGDTRIKSEEGFYKENFL